MGFPRAYAKWRIDDVATVFRGLPLVVGTVFVAASSAVWVLLMYGVAVIIFRAAFGVALPNPFG
jgi:hypothetical protein